MLLKMMKMQIGWYINFSNAFENGQPLYNINNDDDNENDDDGDDDTKVHISESLW